MAEMPQPCWSAKVIITSQRGHELTPGFLLHADLLTSPLCWNPLGQLLELAIEDEDLPRQEVKQLSKTVYTQKDIKPADSSQRSIRSSIIFPIVAYQVPLGNTQGGEEGRFLSPEHQNCVSDNETDCRRVQDS